MFCKKLKQIIFFKSLYYNNENNNISNLWERLYTVHYIHEGPGQCSEFILWNNNSVFDILAVRSQRGPQVQFEQFNYICNGNIFNDNNSQTVHKATTKWYLIAIYQDRLSNNTEILQWSWLCILDKPIKRNRLRLSLPQSAWINWDESIFGRNCVAGILYSRPQTNEKTTKL